jgi:Zn finger protein HypA/HybF involved in hydrogenase expression
MKEYTRYCEKCGAYKKTLCKHGVVCPQCKERVYEIKRAETLNCSVLLEFV